MATLQLFFLIRVGLRTYQHPCSIPAFAFKDHEVQSFFEVTF